MNIGKVVYSTPSWLPVTMNWIYKQIQYQNGFVPLILTNQTENLDQLPNFPIATLNSNFERDAQKFFHFIGLRLIPEIYQKELLKYQPLLLHSHFGDRGWFDLPMVNRYEMKQVVTFYGYDLSLLPKKRAIWNKRYRELFAKADLFLGEGPHMVQRLVNMGCGSEKVKVHRLGVDVGKIPFRPRTFRKKESFSILIAGRFIEKKGIPFALDAIGKVKGKIPDIQVTIVGDSSGTKRDVKEKEKILQIIEKNHLTYNVKLMGYQPHQILLEQAYKHHVFLSPSVTSSDGDTEGGAPVAIIEMLATGIPVISTFHCDIPEVITNGVSGFLSPERDSDDLAIHLLWLFENPESWNNIMSAGRSHVEKYFNVKIQGQELMNIYEGLCN